MWSFSWKRVVLIYFEICLGAWQKPDAGSRLSLVKIWLAHSHHCICLIGCLCSLSWQVGGFMVMTLRLWHCGTLDACVGPCPLWCGCVALVCLWISVCVYIYIYIYVHVYRVCVCCCFLIWIESMCVCVCVYRYTHTCFQIHTHCVSGVCVCCCFLILDWQHLCLCISVCVHVCAHIVYHVCVCVSHCFLI